jgi:FkbM family methyltransferase
MMARVLLPLGRACLRLLRTGRRRVGRAEKGLRALLLLPPFGSLLVLLRLRAWLKGPLVVEGVTDDGVRMRCRLPDLIQMYVHLFGTWEPDLAAFLRRRLGAGDVVVDVGANVGCVAALAALLVGRQGRVIAIEPSPEVVAALRDTLARTGVDNVRIVESAASDRDEELTLFAGPEHNVGLTATVAHRGLQAHGRVRAAPLAQLVTAEELAAARLVKIDVEGAEDRVLAGLVGHLDRMHREVELVVELSPTWWADAAQKPIDVLRPFLAAGFHVYVLENSYWPWRYLWPNDVGAPRRLTRLDVLERRVPRLDLVLSRRDCAEL